VGRIGGDSSLQYGRMGHTRREGKKEEGEGSERTKGGRREDRGR